MNKFRCISKLDSLLKKSFPLRICSVNATKSADLVTFTEETLKRKLHFWCSGLVLTVKVSKEKPLTREILKSEVDACSLTTFPYKTTYACVCHFCW